MKKLTYVTLLEKGDHVGSDCIEYTGYVSKVGYGLQYDPVFKKTISAHRFTFRENHGYLPPVVMHTCDNKRCVNPNHLVGGTQAENIQDCSRKGRLSTTQKLSLVDCEHIKNSKFSSRMLAKYYGVNQKTICNIKNNAFNYKDITHGSNS